MSRSNEADQETVRKYQELCADLNMDKSAAEEAWQSFMKISSNYTLEGDSLHWLACALYVACRKGAVLTVSRTSYVEGNCVSLTRLLRSCSLSLIQFFSKMKKWSDMANLSQDMRQKVDRLERNFNVSMVIFKKFEPIFLDLFKDPSTDPPRSTRSRKQKKPPCTSSDVLAFCWTLFVYIKGHFPQISDDLVNSFHLLLCCVDFMFSNAVIADRRDILQADFPGLPEKFQTREYRPPSEAQCIMQLLCKSYHGLVIEAKCIKEHGWKPAILKLMTNSLLKGKRETFSGFLDVANFDFNSKSINREYEMFVLNIGDFDERVFLGEKASEEIGTSSRPSQFGPMDPDWIDQLKMKRNLHYHMQESKPLVPSTPLTGRRYLKDKDMVNSTPVSMATQSVSRLQTLLADAKPSPSAELAEVFKSCKKDPTDNIVSRINSMGEVFSTAFSDPGEDHFHSHMEFAKKRLLLGQTLYFKSLEKILKYEKNKLPPNSDLTIFLEHDVFNQSLFACCLEIVIFSYNAQRLFPWILQIFDIQPYHFYKVIEVLIRAEDGLSRDVVKHLNHIEEQIIESLAWKSESPLWDALKADEQPVPSCQDVSLPSQMESSSVNSQQVANTSSALHLLQSPISIPGLKRAALRRVDLQQSPLPSATGDRFSSPINPSGARRRLFSANTGSSEVSENQVPGQHTMTTTTGGIVGRTVPITLQCENGLAIISIPTIVTATPAPQATSLNTTSIPVTPTPPNTPHQQAGVPASPLSEAGKTNKPRRGGSLGLFFRKVYHLAGVRVRDLCDRLGITNDELRRRIWTCFEYSLMKHTDLMCDRHLDQLIMCSVYVMCKVTKEDQSFQDIMGVYRHQPQASSHVYRSVLLVSKKRRHSGSSDNSKSGGTSPPVSGDKEEKGDTARQRSENLSSIRSSSTLPVPHPNSQPPTPTQMTGAETHFEFEDRGDLITFYNKVYVPLLQKFALKFSPSVPESPNLSPLPRLNSNPSTPGRRVSAKHSLFISPLTNPNFPPSPNRPLTYNFSSSPAKDLRAINNMVRMGEKRVGKRFFQDEGESDGSPVKKYCNEFAMRRLNNVLNERQGTSGIPE